MREGAEILGRQILPREDEWQKLLIVARQLHIRHPHPVRAVVDALEVVSIDPDQLFDVLLVIREPEADGQGLEEVLITKRHRPSMPQDGRHDFPIPVRAEIDGTVFVVIRNEHFVLEEQIGEIDNGVGR